MKKMLEFTLKECLIAILLLAFSINFPTTLWAAQFTGNGVAYLKQVEKRYKMVRYFRAKFIQTSLAPGVIRAERARGIVYLRKDGKFRWDYDEPEPVIIVSDGNTLWIYEVEDKQVMVDTSFKTRMKRFPYTFLKGMERLDNDFNARVLNATNTNITLELTPKKAIKEIAKMQLTLDKVTLLIHKIEWVSTQEVKTIISFVDIDITSNIPDSVFQFVPPEGVDIVRTDTP